MRTQIIIEKYRKASNRLILLDYDGTLVNFTVAPEKAVPTDDLVDILRNLICKRNTKIVVVTGRSQMSIESLLGHIPIKIVSDHGGMVKEGSQWRPRIVRNNAWESMIMGIMNNTAASCPESFVEHKLYSLAWHYRNADEIDGNSVAKRLSEQLQPYLRALDLKLMTGKKVIEIMPKAIGKGSAVQELFNLESFDYVLSIGDDEADEEIFEVLSKSDISHTIKVGPGNTMAKYRVNQVEDVHSLLNNITK